MIYHAHDRFLNINTGEIDTYNNLTSCETDPDTMLAWNDEEFEEHQQQTLNYFNDMLKEGTLVAVKE
jgi:hypothetical protein